MINIDKINSVNGYRFILAPNCSISWRELLGFYLVACLVVLAVGLLFTLQGLWLVLPFSGLEMLALGAAFHLTSRKVHRREVITLDHVRIRIEKGIQQVNQSWEFDTTGTRLIDEQTSAWYPRRKLVISALEKTVEVGDFLDNLEK